jgi:hypothetical protein
MVNLHRKQEGYIALLTVLIVGAVATAIALTLLLSGANNNQTALVKQRSMQARALAVSCAEEALQTLRGTNTYTGTASLTLTTGSCTYTIANSSGTRSILATGTVSGVARKIQVYATIGTSSISITSWQEVI